MVATSPAQGSPSVAACAGLRGVACAGQVRARLVPTLIPLPLPPLPARRLPCYLLGSRCNRPCSLCLFSRPPLNVESHLSVFSFMICICVIDQNRGLHCCRSIAQIIPFKLCLKTSSTQAGSVTVPLGRAASPRWLLAEPVATHSTSGWIASSIYSSSPSKPISRAAASNAAARSPYLGAASALDPAPDAGPDPAPDPDPDPAWGPPCLRSSSVR